MRVSDLAKEKKWWSGPDFLQKEESDWPVGQIDTDKVSEETENKKQLKPAHRHAKVTETGQRFQFLKMTSHGVSIKNASQVGQS